MAKSDLSKLPEGRKPLPDEWFRERAQMQERIEERQKHLQTMWGLWIKAETQNAEYLGRIEELEADNARLETEAKLQAEEIDKTRRRADKWQSMVLDCGEYLKPGETPAERIEREINDCLALMKLLEKKQMRIQELEAENKRLKALVADVIYSTGDDPEIMAASRAEWAARALAAEAKLANAILALDEAIYLLDPDDEDIAKETGLHRIVTICAELKGEK